MDDGELRIVVGPTAAGKSAAALRLAERIGAAIVSADSRQIYRGMTIGTAFQRAPYGAFGAQLYGKTNPDDRGQLFIDAVKLRTVLGAAHAKGFPHRGDEADAIGALVACVRVVQPSVARGDPGELDDLFRGAERSGRVKQA